MSVGKGEIDKLEFMGLEFASLYGEYLEFAETNQPPLCKGRLTKSVNIYKSVRRLSKSTNFKLAETMAKTKAPLCKGSCRS